MEETSILEATHLHPPHTAIHLGVSSTSHSHTPSSMQISTSAPSVTSSIGNFVSGQVLRASRLQCKTCGYLIKTTKEEEEGKKYDGTDLLDLESV